MRNSLDLTYIWSEVILAIRLGICDYALESNWAVSTAPVAEPSTMEDSQLLLPLCLGESDEIIDDHWIHAKWRIKSARNDVNSPETVGIFDDSFAKKNSTVGFPTMPN
jgi:hypothetical protein